MAGTPIVRIHYGRAIAQNSNHGNNMPYKLICCPLQNNHNNQNSLSIQHA